MYNSLSQSRASTHISRWPQMAPRVKADLPRAACWPLRCGFSVGVLSLLSVLALLPQPTIWGMAKTLRDALHLLDGYCSGCSLLYMVTSLGGPVGDVSRRAWNRNRCVYLHNWGLFVYFACFVFVFPACPAVLHSLRIQQSQSQTQAHLPQGWGSFRHAPWRLRSGPASYHSSSSSSPSPEQMHSLIGLALYEI